MPEVSVHEDSKATAWKNEVGRAALSQPSVQAEASTGRMERASQHQLRLSVFGSAPAKRPARRSRNPSLILRHFVLTSAPSSHNYGADMENGGNSQAGETRQLPKWSKDERVLALDLYLRTRGRANSVTMAEIEALSESMHRLRIWPLEVRQHPKFRTADSVGLKLANFAGIDPAYPGKGMPNRSKGDVETWNKWAHRPAELHALAMQILEVGTAEDLTEDPDPEDDFEADEGAALYRKHRRLERNRTLVRRKKKQVLSATGALACEVCGFNSKESYGVEWVIDVHHTVPLHQIGKSRTRLSDLALVCPTCHRTIHAHKPFITPAELSAKAHSWR